MLITAGARKHTDRGISTLEVLIAIVVISIAALASYRALGQSAAVAADMEMRLYALEVARNRAEEIKLLGVRAARTLPEAETMGPVAWQIAIQEAETAVGLIEVAITVQAEGNPGARLVTFMPLDPAQ